MSETRSVAFPFLRGWSRAPKAVGLPFPSSSWTSRRLARAAIDAALPGGGPLLELGAGTGPVTGALLEAGWPIDKLIVIERDIDLCRTLERRFRGLWVLHGDALQSQQVLERARIPSVCVALSGLPMRAVEPLAAAHYYGDLFDAMPPGGAIIQYTYGFRPPVDPAAVAPKLEARFVGREWRNLPPMGIWSYRRSCLGDPS